ncbi:unnamed protein product, partial [Brenthis ino]
MHLVCRRLRCYAAPCRSKELSKRAASKQGETVALAASVISRMNHYLKSTPVARVKESELKGPRGAPVPHPFRVPPPPRMPARKG